MSQEERMLILQMVADKKISVEEAAELLKALEPREAGPKETRQSPFTGPKPPNRPFPPFAPMPPIQPVLSGLGSFIESVVEKVTGTLTDVFEPRHEFPTELTGEFAGDEVPIRIVTGNGRVEVKAWSEPGFKASILVKASGATEAEARTRASNAYTLRADGAGFDLETRRWDWGETAVHVTLLVPQGKAYRLEARTGNGRVELEGLAMADARLGSGNGRIAMRGGSAGQLSAKTGVGSVDIEGDVAELEAQTGNGSVTVTPTGSRRQTLRLTTGNGSVNVHTVKVGAGAGFKVDAHTGMGGVNIGLPSLVYDNDVRSTSNKNVLARTVNYETAAVPVSIVARTGMGSVTIE